MQRRRRTRTDFGHARLKTSTWSSGAYDAYCSALWVTFYWIFMVVTSCNLSWRVIPHGLWYYPVRVPGRNSRCPQDKLVLWILPDCVNMNDRWKRGLLQKLFCRKNYCFDRTFQTSIVQNHKFAVIFSKCEWQQQLDSPQIRHGIVG